MRYLQRFEQQDFIQDKYNAIINWMNFYKLIELDFQKEPFDKLELVIPEGTYLIKKIKFLNQELIVEVQNEYMDDITGYLSNFRMGSVEQKIIIEVFSILKDLTPEKIEQLKVHSEAKKFGF